MNARDTALSELTNGHLTPLSARMSSNFFSNAPWIRHSFWQLTMVCWDCWSELQWSSRWLYVTVSVKAQCCWVFVACVCIGRYGRWDMVERRLSQSEQGAFAPDWRLCRLRDAWLRCVRNSLQGPQAEWTVVSGDERGKSVVEFIFRLEKRLELF